MILEQLPDIPRLYTAIAEWAACLLYVVLVRRKSATAVAVFSAVALPVFIGWQFIAGRLPSWAWIGGMLTAAALMWLYIMLATGSRPIDAGYLAARAFVLAELVASLHWQLYAFALQSRGESVALEWATLVFIYTASLVISYLVEKRHFSREEKSLHVDNRALTMTLSIAALTFFVSNLSFVSPNTPFSGRLGMEVFYIRTLVDLAGFVALYAQQGQRLESHRALELHATTVLLNAQHEQYLQSQRNIDQVNRKYHDLKHYIAAIRAETSPEKRSDFLDQLESSIRGYEYEVNTGNPILNAILGPKLARCHELDINATCVVDGAALTFMDAMSLSALFGNALDNAIESVEKVPQEQRLIKITAYQKDSFVLVRVENHFDGEVCMVDGLPQTTKNDSLTHGYGMKNMKSVVESYGGSLTVRAQDGWFTILALLPAQEHIKT